MYDMFYLWVCPTLLVTVSKQEHLDFTEKLLYHAFTKVSSSSTGPWMTWIDPIFTSPKVLDPGYM